MYVFGSKNEKKKRKENEGKNNAKKLFSFLFFVNYK